MRRNYNEKSNIGEEFMRPVVGILGMGLVYLVFLSFVNKKEFWRIMGSVVFPLVVVFIIAAVLYVFYLYKVKEKRKNHFKDILNSIKENNFENSIKNFIEKFGKESKGRYWPYRDYKFDWKRLEDFRETFIQNNINITKEDYSELLLILKHYIDEREKNYLNQGLGVKSTNNLNELSKNGNDFENLIVRLYDAMGYTSKRIGAHGDQGGDVIANKNGDSLLIQAKCYQGSVGNAAVQQAAAAMPHYGCTKAAVVTTSY